MSYQDILDEKDKNISRIDEFIDFLRKNFKELDKYNQLVALLNKEKKLYLKLGEKDSNESTKELKDIGCQISLKILEIKNNKINVIHEINSEDKKKILEPDKLLDENMHSIKKALYKNFKNIFFCLSDYKENNANKVREFLEETFFNCDCKGSPQSKILELLTSIKNSREILKNKKTKKNFNKEIEVEIAKEKFSDKFIKKKKEELLNNEAIKIKNGLLSNKLFEYYLANFYEQKSIKDHVNAILKFYPLILSGISLISMICYFVYFGVFIGYFPVLSGSDIFYFGGLLFFTIAIVSIIAILPMFLYPEYYKTGKNEKLLLATTIPPMLIYTYLLYISSISKLYVFLSAYLLIIFLICLAFKFKEWFNKKSWLYILLAIVTSIAGLAILIYFTPNEYRDVIKNLLILSSVMCFFIPLGFLFYMEGFYRIKEYKIILTIFAISIPPFFFITLTNYIAEQFELSNINYKYLVIEKSALGAISDKIHQNNKNIGKCKTYYEEDKVSGTIKLYDIKALSTLGKFYYLEAIGCKNNEKIRFELDASKIISRKKQER